MFVENGAVFTPQTRLGRMLHGCCLFLVRASRKKKKSLNTESILDVVFSQT